MSEWISIKNKTPSKNGSYLVYQKLGYRFTREFFNGTWQNAKSDKYGVITHWMPLPEPPK